MDLIKRLTPIIGLFFLFAFASPAAATDSVTGIDVAPGKAFFRMYLASIPTNNYYCLYLNSSQGIFFSQAQLKSAEGRQLYEWNLPKGLHDVTSFYIEYGSTPACDPGLEQLTISDFTIPDAAVMSLTGTSTVALDNSSLEERLDYSVILLVVVCFLLGLDFIRRLIFPTLNR